MSQNRTTGDFTLIKVLPAGKSTYFLQGKKTIQTGLGLRELMYPQFKGGKSGLLRKLIIKVDGQEGIKKFPLKKEKVDKKPEKSLFSEPQEGSASWERIRSFQK